MFSIDEKENKIRFEFLGIKFSYKISKNHSEKKSKNFAKIIHKNIKRYKYVHIMKNDKFNKPFVDFLNANFDPNEHMVLCYRDPKYNKILQKFPVGKNVYEFIKISHLDLNYNNVEKVIFHSIYNQTIVDYLYKNDDLLKNKSYWYIWGADLYNAPRDEKNDYVRSNFRGYLTDFDVDVTKNKYNLFNKPFFCIHAMFPITKTIINNVSRNKSDYIKIQINNSCDDSTLEMLDILSKFKNENIKITTILSCGKMQFKDEIIKKGTEIFGDKFEYINELLSAEDYAQHLAQNDILILNQNRQQGVGNTIVSLTFGKTVFIRKEISTFDKLKSFGINLRDTNEIKDLSFVDFLQNNNLETNQKNAMKFFDDEYKASLWRAVFDAE